MCQCRDCASELRNQVLDVGDAWRNEDWEASENAIALSTVLAPVRELEPAATRAPDLTGVSPRRNGEKGESATPAPRARGVA
jgi:hypothetical protein